MNRRSVWLNAVIGCAVLLVPVALLWAGWPLLDALLAVALLPAAVTTHELGHALTAWLLGMEMGGLDIGHGRVLIRFAIGAMPVRFHAILLSGRVIYGARSPVLLRLRAWLITLMGPMANAAALAAVFIWPLQARALAGPVLPYVWIAVNAWCFGALLPAKAVVRGQLIRTDGLQLMRIPFYPREELQPLLHAAAVQRALDRLDCEDFAGTQRWVQTALERVPADVALTQWLADCHNYKGEHLQAAGLLTELLGRAAPLTAARRAGLRGDLAFTMLMTYACAPAATPALEHADRLSAEVFAMFPCILEHRSTRALVLCVRHRPAEALALLDYVHYRRANRRQAGVREMVRALALRALDRPAEAREAVRCAVQRFAATGGWLKSLGMEPEPGAGGERPQART